MVIHNLTPAECREVLERTSLGKLACARDDQPYIVPIFFYFDFDIDCLYSFAAVGQKIAWMRANPKVCVEVDEVVSQFHWTSVVVFGRYQEILETVDADAYRRAYELFQRRPEWWLPGAAKPAPDEARQTVVVYRIVIETISGRRAARPHRP